MKLLFILSIIILLDFIAIVLIAINEIEYLGKEKIFPILFVVFIPVIGAIVMILKLKGKGNQYYCSNGGENVDYPPSCHDYISDCGSSLDGGL